MKIIINASRVGKVGGLRSYAAAFVRCFEEMPDAEVIVPQGVELETPLIQREVPMWLSSSSRVSIFRPILWWVYAVAWSAVSRDARVVSTTHHVFPFCRYQIVTVHDLRPYFHPDTWIQSYYFRHALPRALRRCVAVFTVSETTRRALVEVYRLDPARVHVVGNVVDCDYFSSGESVEAGVPYILCVGASWRHKNTHELLAMHTFWSSQYRLKIVGGEGQYFEFLHQRVQELGIAEKVDFLTSLSREQLRSLYRGSSALIYPSIMEGFGIPPLEAMACGCPVIVSDIPVFREMFRSVPLYVKLGVAGSWRGAFNSIPTYGTERRRDGVLLAFEYSQQRMKSEVMAALEQSWGGFDFDGSKGQFLRDKSE